MKTVLFAAETRGHANHGWLDSWHTFSFANYYDPRRIHFGALRVINDDTVAPSEGFGTHAHDNMEIVSIPLAGTLRHRDSMGHEEDIRPGEVQVMSAGTGITHSEFNASDEDPVRFFQIWIFSDAKNHTPRYMQQSIEYGRNALKTIVAPENEAGSGLWIHQDAWLSMGVFDKGTIQRYTLHKEGHGVYAMVVEGSFEVAGMELSRRDGLGIWEAESFDVTALTSDARILLIEVPMTV